MIGPRIVAGNRASADRDAPSGWGGRAAAALLAVLAVALTVLTVLKPPAATESADRYPAPYQVHYVSEMPFTAIANGVGPVERDLTNGGEDAEDGDPIEIDGTRYDRGLGVHPDSRVRLHRSPGCDRFLATVAVAPSPEVLARLVFTVAGDGLPLYQSAPLASEDGPQEVDVELPDVERIDLVVSSGQSDGGTSASAVWADARLLCLG